MHLQVLLRSRFRKVVKSGWVSFKVILKRELKLAYFVEKMVRGISQARLKELSPHRMFSRPPQRRVQSILLTEVLEFRHLCSQIA